jgi:ribonuclease inhibitor
MKRNREAASKRIVLDGTRIGNVAGIYDALTAQLGLAPAFGRNLDALWDVLTVEAAGPIELVWRGSTLSRARLGAAYESLAQLFLQVAAARADFHVRFD